MRLSTLPFLCLLLIACGTSERAVQQPPATWVIPAGAGEWAIVERELPLESLTQPRLILPYGAASTGRGLKRDQDSTDPKDVLRYQVVFRPDPLAAGDRCGLELLVFQVVHMDGSVTEVPAKGHLVDNSDHGVGFRAQLSATNRKQLVIPANATGTVMFAEPITVRTR